MNDLDVNKTKTKNSLLGYIANNFGSNDIYKKSNKIYPFAKPKSSIEVEIILLVCIGLFAFFYFVTPYIGNFISNYITS